MSRKIYAAILGAGTVGTGVYKLCQSMKDDVISKTGLWKWRNIWRMLSWQPR